MSVKSLPMGCLTTDTQRNKKVLVTWEHEEILFVEKHDAHTNVVLVDPSICTKGMLHPHEAFEKQFSKLKLLLEKCQEGAMSFTDFLTKIGQKIDDKFFSCELKFVFL